MKRISAESIITYDDSSGSDVQHLRNYGLILDGSSKGV